MYSKGFVVEIVWHVVYAARCMLHSLKHVPYSIYHVVLGEILGRYPRHEYPLASAVSLSRALQAATSATVIAMAIATGTAIGIAIGIGIAYCSVSEVKQNQVAQSDSKSY